MGSVLVQRACGLCERLPKSTAVHGDWQNSCRSESLQDLEIALFGEFSIEFSFPSLDSQPPNSQQLCRRANPHHIVHADLSQNFRRLLQIATPDQEALTTHRGE